MFNQLNFLNLIVFPFICFQRITPAYHHDVPSRGKCLQKALFIPFVVGRNKQ